MRVVSLVFVVGCAGSAPHIEATPPPPARTCEDVYEDLTRYYAADPDLRRPAALSEDPFLHTCRELPADAQRCLMFSYMQAHSSQCDETLRHVRPELMQRLGRMTGK